MAGLPPPPPPPPPRPSGSGAPPADNAPETRSDLPPSGPPIRRPDATLPQPEPPAAPSPEPVRHAAGLRQLLAAGVVALAVVAIVIALVAGAGALLGGDEENDLDTTAAVDALREMLANAESGDLLDECPVDLDAIVESAAEPLDSEVVYDALDLGDGNRPVTFDLDDHAAAINCVRTRGDGAGMAVTSAIVNDADADIDTLLGDVFDEEAEISNGGTHRGGRLYGMEQIDDDEAGDNAIGAVWTDGELIVGLFVGGATEDELDTDPDAVGEQLEVHLDDIVEDLG
jgi:hypothetical protein